MGLSVIKFDREKHLGIIQDWRKGWPIGEYPWELMPENGWIGYDGKRPLCCGFVRLMEGKAAMTDLILSDPTDDPETRKKITALLDMGTDLINAFLKEMGIRVFWTWTQRESMARRLSIHLPGSVAFPAYVVARLEKDV